MRPILIVFICFLFYGTAWSQYFITGKVLNEKTKEPLPFSNITYKESNAGATSDVEGSFKLPWNGKETDLVVSFVGFEPVVLHVNPPLNKPLRVFLKERTTDLNEVVVRPQDNPAFLIIRKVIQNKAYNDPENLSTFSYHSYNKLFLSMEELERDSSKNKKISGFQKFLDRQYLFVSKSYTERKYIKPNLTKETILANKVSGIKDPFFASMATDFQPFSFYKDYIDVFGVSYLNPIAKGFDGKYDFTLSDTLYHDKDSVFVIAFEPLAGKIFEAMKGQLYISSDHYAIEHVIAQAADKEALIAFRIQQEYAKVNGRWFPVQLNSEMRFKEYKISHRKPKYIARSYLTDIHVEEPIDPKEFGLLNVAFDAKANEKDDAFWDSIQSGPIDVKEKNTYRFYDTLGPKLKLLNTYLKVFEGLIVGKVKMGPFYVPIDNLLKFNQYENVRIGVGLQTGEDISEHFVVDGYVGYGIKDRAIKYGGGLQLNLFPSHEGFVKFSYAQDIAEPGGSDFIKQPKGALNNESLRSWLVYRMDSVRRYNAEFAIRPVHFSQFSFFVQQQQRNPTYAYTFTSEKDPTGQQRTFIATEVGVKLRLAWKENYIQIHNSKVVTNHAYPLVNLYASKGFSGVFNGQYDFTKVELQIDQQWRFRGAGVTTVQLNVGKINGRVPYPFLFNGKSSFYDRSFFNSYVVSNYFQTMGLYEFAGDQFAYLFVNQNFGRITSSDNPRFRPELALAQNIGIGSLKNKADHGGIAFNTMEKGFFESGLVVSNILRFKYIKLFHVGLGAGVYYRYGSYSLPDASDNLFYKFSVNTTF